MNEIHNMLEHPVITQMERWGEIRTAGWRHYGRVSPRHGKAVTATCEWPRSAALAVHRTAIHYRRLRFAYPLGKGGMGAEEDEEEYG